MPIHAIISPKFTYGQGYNHVQIRVTANSTNAWKNGMFDYSSRTDTEMAQHVIMPNIEFPVIGNGHSNRKSNRLTVSSIRVKMNFCMDGECLRKFNWFSSAETVTGSSQLPLNPHLFLKFRLFLLSVDDDIEVSRNKLLNWFLATHCMYRYPTVEEVLKGPSDTAVTDTPGPTSVHSSVLRVTTDWTGKFNVLADRKFTISAKNPQFDVDMTIPLRKEFVFDENYDATSKLLYPKLYLFILPPLSWEVDCDVMTSYFCKHYQSSSAIAPLCFHVYSWTKLNFVDL
ncbi:capsid protein [Bovine faeces associated circular DNA virus 2]|uniref:capsid protein n=1 Tax=Bovine faeces associated circular DNA virus 2 TaxID=1843765 RepID=UPI0007C1CFC0|nr:capsid protein [Bovine faeces associated circular DNA virus 2]ANC51562.1 capsid protein [Bovine faeces associated circular DNA virus 2]